MSTAALTSEVVHVQPRQQDLSPFPFPPHDASIGNVGQEWDPEATAAITNEIRKIGRTIQLDCREEMRKVGRRMQDELRLLWRDLPKQGVLSSVPEGETPHNTKGSVSSRVHPSPMFTMQAAVDLHGKLRQAADHNGDGQTMDVLDLEFDAVLKQHLPKMAPTKLTTKDDMGMVKNGHMPDQVPEQAWGDSSFHTPNGVSSFHTPNGVKFQDEQQGEECSRSSFPNKKNRQASLTSADCDLAKYKSVFTNGCERRQTETEISINPPRLTIGRELLKAEEAKRRKAQRKSIKNLTWWELRQMSLRDVIQSVAFDNIVGAIIMLNATIIGFQTDYNARHVTDEVPVHYLIFEQFFCFWFTIELMLRIWVYRSAFFNCRKEGFVWNMFDTFVVSAQLLEVFFDLFARSTAFDVKKVRLLRIMRVLRLLRILRVVRVLHLISELREILASIAGSFRSLIWVVILLALQIFIVAVYFTQSVTDHMVEQSQDEESWSMTKDERFLKDYFGSMSRSVLTLWQAMSGGLDWDTLAEPLLNEISFVTGFAFAVFIAFALLALMNVVTGVFVQTALESAKGEEEAFMTAQIIQLFRIADKDQVLTLEGIEETLEEPDTAQIWKNVNVQSEDAKFLFKLLDLDNSGEIKFEEFLGGCLRLNGNAKAIDILTVMQEQRKTADMFANKLTELERGVAQIIGMLGGGHYQFFASLSNGGPFSGGGGGAASGGGGGNADSMTVLLRHIQEDVSNLLDQGSESRQDVRSLRTQLLEPLRWLQGLASGPEPPAAVAAASSERGATKRPGTTYSNGSWV